MSVIEMPGEWTFDLESAREAASRLAEYLAPTPLLSMSTTRLQLKAESLLPTGSFKLRGAFNALLSLSEDQRRRGVVAHSSGNHAMAVAFAAARLGVEATVVIPSDAPQAKREGARALGARVVEVGVASSERADMVRHLAVQRGLSRIEPYDAPAIIAATATIGLEIIEARPDLEAVFVPVSGGGLIAGVASAIAAMKPDVRIFGVEPAVAADAAASLAAGARTTFSAERMSRTIADGLRVQVVGTLPWPIIQRHVEAIVTVEEADIVSMMRQIAREARVIAEPSGAVAAAGAIARGLPLHRSVAILTGGNVDLQRFGKILMGDA